MPIGVPKGKKQQTKEERLENKINLDKLTARRLFTLICVLHFKG